MPPKLQSDKCFVWHYNCAMTEPKKPRGRPPKPKDEKLHRMTVFLPMAAIVKVEKNGQDWLRAVIKRAKAPVKK